MIGKPLTQPPIKQQQAHKVAKAPDQIQDEPSQNEDSYDPDIKKKKAKTFPVKKSTATTLPSKPPRKPETNAPMFSDKTKARAKGGDKGFVKDKGKGKDSGRQSAALPLGARKIIAK